MRTSLSLQDPYHFDTAAPTKSGGVLAHAVATQNLDILIAPKINFIGDGKTARFGNLTLPCPSCTHTYSRTRAHLNHNTGIPRSFILEDLSFVGKKEESRSEL